MPIFFVIDVGAGDDIPRLAQALCRRMVVINKIDIAPCWSRPGSDSQGGGRATPGSKPIAYTNCKTGSGLDQVVNFILKLFYFAAH